MLFFFSTSRPTRARHVSATCESQDGQCSSNTAGAGGSSEEALDLLQRTASSKAGRKPSHESHHHQQQNQNQNHHSSGSDSGKPSPKRPHVLYILVDDLGFADVGFNNKHNPEVRTPSIDYLARRGVTFARHYVANQCGPTRVAAQSGRLPIHGQMKNDADSTVTAGMSTKMTGVAEKLSEAGYKTHYVGKWDVGMATHHHLPRARGYSTSLGYFHKGNDQFTQHCPTSHIGCCAPGLVDLWQETEHGQGPARDLNGTDYQEFIFLRRMEEIIDSHDKDDPLLLFYAPHVAHCPLQVPDDYMKKFSWMENDWDCSEKGYDQSKCRQRYRASVHLLDDIVRKLVRKFKKKGMWDDLLIIFTADNGGPVHLGATNYPLRGGKATEFEGGYRGAALASGGVIPQSQWGKRLQGIAHIADWYTTLSHLAGVPFHDLKAEASGAPDVDGYDLWPWLVGQEQESPRHELALSDRVLMAGRWKFMRGKFPGAAWTGINHPNSSYSRKLFERETSPTLECDETLGCLFDVDSDPGEHNDLAQKHPEVAKLLQQRLQEVRQTIWHDPHVHSEVCPNDTEGHICACWMAINYYGGFYGPFAGQGDTFHNLEKIKKNRAAALANS
eukprot:CAMPEP_0178423458 /NCGR_PEP_ID=MMETSP0689_2-20121128/27699_1 /TAXON_ID=160604 /ORGANISM="Amphidinium massartii, Strain CS-259" /LENGTH=613 /DNA_ID=CAMNT_0020045053 /DNA_START=61 /DNA_END=1902 /DNA_ORIENTATION=+